MEASNASKSVLPEKKRFEWIDNARIIAALLIIYYHMPGFFDSEPHVNNLLAIRLVGTTSYSGRVPFFLILAGYFLARRITWHKAWDRSLWLFIPFVIWNVLYYLGQNMCSDTTTSEYSSILSIIGIGAIFTEETTFFGLKACSPVIISSWFLRDIIVLSLLTPLLFHIRRYLLVLLAILCCFTSASFHPHFPVLLSPGTCFYYLLGVCLVDFRIDDAYKILNERFALYAVFAFIAAAAVTIYATLYQPMDIETNLLGGILGALMIAYSGVLIEKHLPNLSKRLAPCGPACFLVFMLHEPLFRMLVRLELLPGWLTGSWVVWLLPIPACAFIITMFLLMKRLTPWLMPYLGHMKMPKSAQKSA